MSERYTMADGTIVTGRLRPGRGVWPLVYMSAAQAAKAAQKVGAGATVIRPVAGGSYFVKVSA